MNAPNSNRNFLFLGCLNWLSGGGGGTVAAIKCIHWQPGLTLPGGFLVHWVFLHYKARGLLVWGKVQKGLHYHCSGACSNKTFLVCKKVQWVLYYKGFFWSIRRWCGALHYKAISRLGKVQLKLGWMGSIVRLVREVTTEVGWNWWSDLLKRLRRLKWEAGASVRETACQLEVGQCMAPWWNIHCMGNEW